MNTKTKNTPVYAGAMTPAELHQRTLHRLAFTAGALALTFSFVLVLGLLLLI